MPPQMTAVFIAVIFLIVGFCALSLVQDRMKAKVQRFEEIKKHAMIDLQLGSGDLPSWIHDEDRFEEFRLGVLKLISHKRVPQTYAQEVIEKEANYLRLMRYAGTLECRKASFFEQQIATADLIAQWWYESERPKFFST